MIDSVNGLRCDGGGVELIKDVGVFAVLIGVILHIYCAAAGVFVTVEVPTAQGVFAVGVAQGIGKGERGLLAAEGVEYLLIFLILPAGVLTVVHAVMNYLREIVADCDAVAVFQRFLQVLGSDGERSVVVEPAVFNQAVLVLCC